MMLLSLLFFSALAQANDFFKAPSAEMQKTKYAQDCGGTYPDLRAEMPPVDNQNNVGWCATFTSRALLEHFYRGQLGGKRFSVMDVNSMDTSEPAAQFARVPNLDRNEGADPFLILEGVQVTGRLHLDQNYPFTQKYFGNAGLIDRLSDYYARQKAYTADPALLACREQDATLSSLEKQFQGISDFLSQANGGDFVSAAGKKFDLVPSPQAGAERLALKPRFHVRRFSPRSGDELIEEIQRNLKEGRPSAAGICALQMKQLPGLGQGMPLTEKEKKMCGSHAVTVVGLKNIGGRCQVQVRNSWGTFWPTPGAGGYTWIPVEDFLAVQQSPTDLTSITPRAEGESVENRIMFEDGSLFVGETWQGQLKRGKLNSPGSTFEGEFAGGQPKEGILIEKNGAEWSGTFYPNGTLYKGKLKGKFAGGAYYEGDYFMGQIQGKGRLVQANGAVFEGSFREGRMIDGHFKGLITDSPELYYSGPFREGKPQPEGKVTDKNGNPVQVNFN